MAASKSSIKVGIAGLGRAGWSIHAEAIAALPELFTLLAVCDPDGSRQAEASERFNCRTYLDLTGLLADKEVELAVIASPSQFHCADAIAALEAGKQVMVEKPLGRNLAEVDRIIAAWRKTGQLLTINQNYRYDADVRKVKEVVQSGILGRILQIRIAVHQFRRRWDWQTLKVNGGGILNNHGAHIVDWAMQLIDDPEPQVFCQMEATPLYAGDAESHVKLILRPASGPVVDIELTHACPYPQDTWLVMGSQGGLTGNRQTLRWKYYRPAEAPALVIDLKPTPDRSYNSEELPMYEQTWQLPAKAPWGELQLYQDLYKTVRQGAPLAIIPESVRRYMAVLQRCRDQNPGL